MGSKSASSHPAPEAPAAASIPGRFLASALLLLLVLTLLGVNLLPQRYPLMGLRLAQFDSYQRLLPRQRDSVPVVIVEINEAELAALGQWPWPRQFVAALIDAIAAAGPSVIGMDMIFAEPDRTSPSALAESRPDLAAGIREALATAMSNDHILASSLSKVPVVLGAAGFDYSFAGQTDQFRAWPFEMEAAGATLPVRNYPHVLASLPSLQAVVKGQALLSSEPEDGVVRKVALVSSTRGQLVPGLALEMLRVAGRRDAVRLETNRAGLSGARLPDRFLPMQANGEAWVHFSRDEAPAATGAPRRVPALALLRGEVPRQVLEGKMVLIGLTAIGLVDTITTPHGDRRPGVEVHAEFLESQQDGRFLLRPAAMAWLEAGTLLATGMLLLWLLPALGLTMSLILLLGLLLGQGALGLAMFHWQGWLFDPSAPLLLSLLMFSVLMLQSYADSLRQKRLAQRALQKQREEAARVAGELEAARRIQLGSLPVAAEVFPDERRFTVEALLEPAREIGGDLYDFYMLDSHRVLFLVGDVAGKGLPASLFMAVAKALSKSVALRGPSSLEEVIKQANFELSRENRETLFVTLLAGILDAQSGSLTLCNAGHDAPYLLRGDGSIQHLEDEHGPPLCVLEDYPYTVQSVQLQAGDRLCIITDGVNEAMNAEGELFGGERLLQALRASRADAADTLASVRRGVRAFVGDAPPSDDLTLLTLQWHGPDGGP